ncbi:bifunctional 2-polyprenyl-6-hydroxyphenol methylase/3-demethylubiquinol 3-O-methyltransferase UbiG [Methylophilus sp. 5]|uniref:class I SAM-dependent methyltransferase n=1 Tax=Methylophilus sp. 5 TaxID=1112274 RepID=UPI000491BF1C|nr:class I SAM-dependent methyltransferase [Methylophilus sp. 5]
MNIATIESYYSARATEYDRVYLKPERQSDLREIERWLPTVFKGSSMIEIACGTGYWTQFLEPVVCELVAIDTSPETLAIASTRISASHVQFMIGDAYRPAVSPGHFSAAFAGFWLSHVPRENLGLFLNTLHQALLPGARVVFLDNRYVEGSSTPISEQDAWGNTYQIRRLEDGTAHRILKNFFTEQELRSAVSFSAIQFEFHTWQHFWAFEYVLF